MKKINIIVAKALSLILTTGILTISIPNQPTYASTNTLQKIQNDYSFETGVLYEDNDFKITQTENDRTVLDKKTSKTTVLTFTDSTHTRGTYKDIDGTIKKYSTDDNGNIYLDDSCFIEVHHSNKIVKDNSIMSLASYGYTNPRSFTGKDGFKYYYVTQNTYNTTTAGNAASIAMGILSFVPYVGTIFGVAGIVETARNLNATTLYVVQDEYCTSDYSHYAYKNYFYSDAKHKDLIDSNVEYKKMF